MAARTRDPSRTVMLRRDYVRFLNRFLRYAEKRIKRLIRERWALIQSPAQLRDLQEEVREQLERIAFIGSGSIRRAVGRIYNYALHRAEVQLHRFYRTHRLELGTWTLADNELLALLQARDIEQFQGLTAEATRQVMREVGEGWMQGESIPQITKRLTDRFRISRSRAGRIARSETIYVYNQAALNRYKTVGVERYDWLVGGAPCSLCSQLATGSPYAVGEGPMPVVDSHPDCVCSIAPSVEGY